MNMFTTLLHFMPILAETWEIVKGEMASARTPSVHSIDSNVMDQVENPENDANAEFIEDLDGRLQEIKDLRLKPTVCENKISLLEVDCSSITGIKSILETDAESLSPSTRQMALEPLNAAYNMPTSPERSEAAHYAEAYRKGELLIEKVCNTPESPRALPLPRSPTESILTISSDGDWALHPFTDPAHAPRAGTLGSYVSPSLSPRSQKHEVLSSNTSCSLSLIESPTTTVGEFNDETHLASVASFEKILAAAQPSKQNFVPSRSFSTCARPHCFAGARMQQLLV